MDEQPNAAGDRGRGQGEIAPAILHRVDRGGGGEQAGEQSGVAVPEEMRGKIPTDYGRSKGVAWYYLGGFGLVQTQASQGRIVKWDSQG